MSCDSRNKLIYAGGRSRFLLAADGTRLMGGPGGRGYLRPPADAPDEAVDLVSIHVP